LIYLDEFIPLITYPPFSFRFMTDTSLFFGAAPVIISEIIRSEADLMRGIGDLKKISSYEECLSVNDKLKKNLQFF
jgi:hypothetical protein